MLHSCFVAVPDGLEIGVDRGLERGPALEWGQDASIHGRAWITVSMAVVRKKQICKTTANTKTQA